MQIFRRYVDKKTRRNRHYTPTEEAETSDCITREQGYYNSTMKMSQPLYD